MSFSETFLAQLPATHLLVELLGAIALLLWGIHMVHSGVLRAYGSDLRRMLGLGLRNRFSAFLAGLGVTAILQSSTATALMATSFTATGVVGLVPALAVLLGANVGTTLIVQLLSFDITLVYPLLIFLGLLAFRRGQQTRTRDLGRVGIGLGLMLLALHLLIAAMAPVEASQGLRLLLAALQGQPLTALLLAGLLTWASHSSVAGMLFIITLANAGAVDGATALAMVLGANLGSAVNPVLAGLGGDPARLRLPLGNLFTRLAGCLLALPLLGPLLALLGDLGGSAGQQAANFHTAFNVVLAALFILPLPWLARLLRQWLPEAAKPADPGAPQYLAPDALDNPGVALSNAAREVLRMADLVEGMLRDSGAAFHDRDRKLVSGVRKRDDVLDRLHAAIQRYLAAVGPARLSEADERRLADSMAFAVNLEHVGDILDKSLMELAAKRIKGRVLLAREDQAAIDDMHQRLVEHLQLAVTVFMLGDARAARRLVKGKEAFRGLEQRVRQAHLARLRAGKVESVETSGLLLDIVRDLKRIEAHIAAIAYPVLERRGEMLASRLAG